MSTSLIDAIGRDEASKLMNDAVARAIKGSKVQVAKPAQEDELDAVADPDQLNQELVLPLKKGIPIA